MSLLVFCPICDYILVSNHSMEDVGLKALTVGFSFFIANSAVLGLFSVVLQRSIFSYNYGPLNNNKDQRKFTVI